MSTENLFNLAKNESLQAFIASNLYDPWVGTPFEGYRYMDNKQKGELGERFVTLMMKELGHTVEMPHSSTAGYDRIINGIKVEIKFGLSHTDNKKQLLKEDCFTMNHVSHSKDWERIIFCGVNGDPNKMRLRWMTKSDFAECCEEFFATQQGGKGGNNDDYMSASKKLLNLLNSEYMKDISEW